MDGTIDDDSSAYSGSKGQQNEGLAASSESRSCFGEGGHVGVIVDFDTKIRHPFLKHGLERYVMPVEVGSYDNGSVSTCDTRYADADSWDI